MRYRSHRGGLKQTGICGADEGNQRCNAVPIEKGTETYSSLPVGRMSRAGSNTVPVEKGTLEPTAVANPADTVRLPANDGLK